MSSRPPSRLLPPVTLTLTLILHFSMVDPPRRRASRPPPRAIFSEQESSRIFRRLRGGGEAERGILGPVDGEAATPIIKRRRYSNWSQYFKR
eukprot:1330346-Amorphochlora_amoeboformis.AAC.1